MVKLSPFGKAMVKLGLASTTLIVAAVYGYNYYWENKRQQELKRKFLSDNPEDENGIDDCDDKDFAERKEKRKAARSGGGTNNPNDKNSEFRPASSRLVTVDITIPREHAPGFIGKNGANIRRIQEETNTGISSASATLDNGDRLYTIRGIPADVKAAELAVKKHLMSQPIVRSVSIEVPASTVGRIIGSGGERIKTIQFTSGARVNTDDGEDSDEECAKKTKTILIRGTDDQIEMANGLIQEIVRDEENRQKNITVSLKKFTNRRGTTGTRQLPVRSIVSELQSKDIFRTNRDGTMEVVVSCVYTPTSFWIQVVGSNNVELDHLSEKMTKYYGALSGSDESAEIAVDDLVASTFDMDDKIYRGKVLEINGSDAMILYLDFGDKKAVPLKDVHPLRNEHLKLRFQAIECTLFPDFQKEWPNEIVNYFCDLCHCAEWTVMTAKIKEHLRIEDEKRDIIWIELFDKYDNRTVNVGDEILKRLAVNNGNVGESQPEISASNGVNNSPLESGVESKLSYASIASSGKVPS